MPYDADGANMMLILSHLLNMQIGVCVCVLGNRNHIRCYGREHSPEVIQRKLQFIQRKRTGEEEKNKTCKWLYMRCGHAQASAWQPNNRAMCVSMCSEKTNRTTPRKCVLEQQNINIMQAEYYCRSRHSVAHCNTQSFSMGKAERMDEQQIVYTNWAYSAHIRHNNHISRSGWVCGTRIFSQLLTNNRPCIVRVYVLHWRHSRSQQLWPTAIKINKIPSRLIIKKNVMK